MQLRVRTGPRSTRFDPPIAEAAEPGELDDALGLCVWRVLAEAISRGSPPPAILLLTPEQAHMVDLVPLLKAGESLNGRGVSGLASLPGVDAMALVGLLTRRQRGRTEGRVAVAFLEWPDGRWWLARRALVPLGSGIGLDPLKDVTVERAVDGHGKPGGIGGWFRRARVEGLRVELHGPEIEN
ncbi:MAG: hypothetical protein EXR69_13190 [Myxococcales bacterium]|nr:hypothetical protein [Myxococcales bacterium]